MRFLIIPIALLMTGCATLMAPTENEIRNNFDSAIGRMSYDEAISSLGQPARMTEGKNVFVSEWVEGNELCQLTFDKQTGLLVSWSYEGITKSPGNFLKEAGRNTAVFADSWRRRQNN